MSDTVLAAGAAVIAAGCYAGSIVLQFTAANNAPPLASAKPRDVLRFFWGTISQPLWLTSIFTEIGGVGLQGFALSRGSLALIQPLMVLSLLFALPLDALVNGARPSRRSLSSAGLTAAGLALFTSLAAPKGEQHIHFVDVVLMVAALALPTAAIVGLALRRGKGVGRAALLGVATGLLFAATGALIKLTAEDLRFHGFVGTLADWPVWTLAVIGVTGMIVDQAAYAGGPLAASLPGITIVDPIVSVVLSVTLFGEDIGISDWDKVGLSLGLLIMSVGALDLARGEGQVREERRLAAEQGLPAT